MMVRLFILTAPFDEEAKTGDGQYASTLETTFTTSYPDITCRWLKKHNPESCEPGYHIPYPQGCTSIPEHTIPSAIVLQPVANGKTVVSGFKLLGSDDTQASIRAALAVMKATVSPKTPKIVVSADGLLLKLIIQTIDRKIIVITPQKLNQIINDLASVNLDGNAKVARDFFTNFNFITQPIISQDTLKNLSPIIDRLTGIKSLYSDNRFIQSRTDSFSDKAGFNRAYQASKNDPTKQKLIASMIDAIQPDSQTYLDIHIRPPDCGVFINPADIAMFKKSGIKVNLTIHEYKQNFNRRYLQQYTHELMRKANRVLFFNQKDRDSAIRATMQGDCDQRNTHHISGIHKKAFDTHIWFKDKEDQIDVDNIDLEKYPVRPYKLDTKSGLTVASQQLSLSNTGHISDILGKPANILSFGTIRPNKGFSQALEVAKLIKKQFDTPTSIPTIHSEMGYFPQVIIAGDPQNKDIMTKLVKERFGEQAVENYQNGANGQAGKPYDDAFSNEEIRSYWEYLIRDLNTQVSEQKIKLHNSFLEIYSFCSKEELFDLKRRCKYVLRMDDMGMRYNASAIISTLDVGIVYAKYGLVTDDAFTPKGVHGAAVDIGEHRYGRYNYKHPEYPYRNIPYGKAKSKMIETLKGNRDKLKDDCRTAEEILTSIRNREQDQREHSENIHESLNYKTVEKAQELLTKIFAPKNACNRLLTIFGLGEYVNQNEAMCLPDIDPRKHQQSQRDQLTEILEQTVLQHASLSSNQTDIQHSSIGEKNRFFKAEPTNQSENSTSDCNINTVASCATITGNNYKTS